MEYFVYIIKSEKDDKNYIGSTSNVEKRLRWHNDGKNKSTKCRKPFKLIYSREFEDKKLALEFERWLKKQKGGVKIKEILRKDN